MDRISTAKRSRNMARIRGSHTAPERVIRSALHGLGFRFRLHRKDLPGRPDIVLPKHSVAVLVHGCFWHHHEGCDRAVWPKTRRVFWREKLRGNQERDRRQLDELLDAGWRVLVIWECAAMHPVDRHWVMDRTVMFIRSAKQILELPSSKRQRYSRRKSA